MEVKYARQIYSIIKEYSVDPDSKGKVEETLLPASTVDFHHWATNKRFEGGFLFKNDLGEKLWILLIEWNPKFGYYLIIFPDDKSGPLAEIHKHFTDVDGDYMRWIYSPSKKDGRNNERKEYFKKYFQSDEVIISMPSSREYVQGFIDEIFSLAENRVAADALNPEKPSLRESFPEGKIKEGLHKSRERNTKLVKQVKAEALEKYGNLECQCCGFDFLKTYGQLGSEFIEAHHTLPISELHVNGGNTKLEDIALVCSNCHRMLHRRRPWLTMSELGDLVNPGKA